MKNQRGVSLIILLSCISLSFQSKFFPNENEMEIPSSQDKGKSNESQLRVNQFMVPKQKPTD